MGEALLAAPRTGPAGGRARRRGSGGGARGGAGKQYGDVERVRLVGGTSLLRAPGTHVPGVITAETFHQDGERVFWDVHDGARAVVIELADERYARLVIEVDEPAATVALIEGAISR